MLSQMEPASDIYRYPVHSERYGHRQIASRSRYQFQKTLRGHAAHSPMPQIPADTARSMAGGAISGHFRLQPIWPGQKLQVLFTKSWWAQNSKFRETVLIFYLKTNNLFEPQSAHATRKCAKLWLKLIITIHVTANSNFIGFGKSAHDYQWEVPLDIDSKTQEHQTPYVHNESVQSIICAWWKLCTIITGVATPHERTPQFIHKYTHTHTYINMDTTATQAHQLFNITESDFLALNSDIHIKVHDTLSQSDTVMCHCQWPSLWYVCEFHCDEYRQWRVSYS